LFIWGKRETTGDALTINILGEPKFSLKLFKWSWSEILGQPNKREMFWGIIGVYLLPNITSLLGKERLLQVLTGDGLHKELA